MATQLGLYNGALRLIKERALVDLTETGPAKLALDAAYADALAYCLELAQWTFAVRSLPFSGVATPGLGYPRSVTLPVDFVRPVAISGSSSFYPPLETYTIANGTLYTDQSIVHMSYVSNNAAYGNDLTKWPMTYTKLVEAHLAVEIAPHITSSVDIIKYARTVFQERLDIATAKDAINRTMRVASSATLGIYNGALRILGKRTLETFSDDVIRSRIAPSRSQDEDGQPQATPYRRQEDPLKQEMTLRRLMDEVYDDAKAFILEQGLWNFALKTAMVDPSPSYEPEFGYANVYEKPDDFVRLNDISESDRFANPLTEFVDEGDFWYADANPIYVSYISNAEDAGYDESKWTAIYKNALEHELAFRIAPSVSGIGITRLQDLERKRDRAIKDCRSKDAMNQPSRPLPSGRLVRSRAAFTSSRGSR